MKIAICDDIESERNTINYYCKALGYNEISLFSSGRDFLESPEIDSFNLVFLDIEMDDIDGIEVKNILENTKPYIFIVFTTVHNELMPNAFGRNVISFLTKPFTERSIKQCINKALYLTKDFCPIIIDEKTSVPCKDILYIHAENKYSIFYTTDGKLLYSRNSLKSWSDKLKEFGFCPISRFAIINLKHYQKNIGKKVLISNNTIIPISRRYLQLLEDSFSSYKLQMLINN